MTKLLLAVAILASIALSTEAFLGFTTKHSFLNREPLIYPQRSIRAVELEYIEQRVDNFNPQNTNTYRMVNNFPKFRRSNKKKTNKNKFINSDTTATMNFSKRVGQSLFTLAVNGPSIREVCAEAICTIWLKN